MHKLDEDSPDTIEALKTRPEIPLHLLEFVRAFQTLSTRRTAGFSSLNPIALSEVLTYINLFGEPLFGREVFVALIGRMDAKYLGISRERRSS